MRKEFGCSILPFLLMFGSVPAHSAEKVTYVYADGQGTPLAETDANGTITKTFDYKPYGGQALGSPPAGPGYTGHVNDPEAGLIYMQARYYDPAVGRLLSADPMTPTPGELFRLNRYDYANNNPVINIDPDGRENCPGQSRSRCVRSDSGAARNLESTEQQDSAAIASKRLVETAEKPERAVALIGTTDVTVLPIIGEVIQTTGKDGINLKNLPPGTGAIEHSHIDGKTVGVSSEGFVSPGDAQPLGHGVINYAVSERRVAKYEIVGGRIQVTAIEGRFTSPESTKLEQSINAQQPAIDAVRPSE